MYAVLLTAQASCPTSLRMNSTVLFRKSRPLTSRKIWVSVAGSTLICFAAVLGAAGSTDLQSTIVQNGAPIAIDRCVVARNSDAHGSPNDVLSEDVGFTNISQQTVTQVRFRFEIVDASGRTERTVTDEKSGTFAPGVAINDAKAAGALSDDAGQRSGVSAQPIKVLCLVQFVRFEDGSIWHEGDSPAGNASIYTPLPGPTPTTQWQWPYDPPTP
jgi:hypothetical protein